MISRLFAACAVVSVFGLSQVSLAQPAAGHVIHNPDWVERPTAQSLLAVFPAKALAQHIEGDATIGCTVTVQGSLRDCAVLSEHPTGMGFGAAALALTPQFHMRPMTIDGQPVESRINVPINFKTNGTSHTGSRLPAMSTGGTVLSHVAWKAAPSYADVAAAYPIKAREAKVGGLATLACYFAPGGKVHDCGVISETPAGMGFGDAAKKLSKLFVGPDKLASGESTYGILTQIPFAFSPDMTVGGAPVVGRPQWAHLPEALDVAASFPAAATAAHVSTGHVVLGCDIAAGGLLTGCTVERQFPEGLGFGAAAMAMSSQFRVSVWTDEGLPTVGGRLEVPIRYETTAPAVPVADAAPPPRDATALTAPSPPTNIQWVRAPNSADMAWPAYAFYAHVSGRAVLDCVINTKEKLDPCAVVEDTPKGQGFAQAAIEFLQPTKMRPPTVDGVPVQNAHVQITIDFDGSQRSVSFTARSR